MTELKFSVIRNDIAAVKKLLRRGADIDEPDEVGNTPLMLATEGCQMEMIRLLIDEGADFSKKNRYGYNLLMQAAQKGDSHMEVAQLLLDKSADINEDSHAVTALMLAACGGHNGMVRLLVDNGASLDKKNKLGFTALGYARNLRHPDTAQILEEAAEARRRAVVAKNQQRLKDLSKNRLKLKIAP
jgi:ankyrin repeat protein